MSVNPREACQALQEYIHETEPDKTGGIQLEFERVPKNTPTDLMELAQPG